MIETKMSFMGNEPHNFLIKMRELIDQGIEIKAYAILSEKCYTQKDLPKSKRKVIVEFNYEKGGVILGNEHIASLVKFIVPPTTIHPQIGKDYEEYIIKYDAEELLENKKTGI